MVAAFGLRVANRAQKEVVKAVGKDKDIFPSSADGLLGNQSPMARSNSWMGDSTEWKRR